MAALYSVSASGLPISRPMVGHTSAVGGNVSYFGSHSSLASPASLPSSSPPAGGNNAGNGGSAMSNSLLHPNAVQSVSPHPSLPRSRSRDHSPGPFKHDVPKSTSPVTPDRSVYGNNGNGNGNGANNASKRGRAGRNQNHITILTPRAAASTVPGVVQPVSSSLAPLSMNNNSAATAAQRKAAVTGYSYTSRVRSPRNVTVTAQSIQRPPPAHRYNFHAASLSERAAADSLAYAVESHPPLLNSTAAAAFMNASIPSSASATLSHFSHHPITFATHPVTGGAVRLQQQQQQHQRSISLTDSQVTNAANVASAANPLMNPNGQMLPPLPPTKHDRGSQTSPLQSPRAAPAPAAAAPPLPPFSLIPAAVATVSDASFTSNTRRKGYEWTHSKLMELHHSPTFAFEEFKEEHSENETKEEMYFLMSGIARSEDQPRMISLLENSMNLNFFEDALATFYASLGKWDEFDIFELYDVTNGWPLSFLFMMIDRKHHILESNNIDPVTAFHFIQEVESNYLPNPYHTACHAADVLHAAFHLVEHTPVVKNGLSSLDCFVLYISCAVHDFQHPGVNNSFLCNSRAPLALRYNDRSVLESFHISGAFRMMHVLPHCNILAGFPFADYSKIRKNLIDLVLATDLAVHFELMGVFKRKIPTANIVTSEEDRLMIMQIILKCGDLSHPARSRRLHLKWSELVTEEFFLQGDRERILKLPPSMFMQRNSTNLAQSQIGFITFLVFPMFQAYNSFSQRDFWSKKVEENLDWWQEVARVEAEEKKREAERQEALMNGGVVEDENSAGISEPNSASVSTSAGSSHVTSRRASVESLDRSRSNSTLSVSASLENSNTVPNDLESPTSTITKKFSDDSTTKLAGGADKPPLVKKVSFENVKGDGEILSKKESQKNRIMVMPVVSATPNASFNASSRHEKISENKESDSAVSSSKKQRRSIRRSTMLDTAAQDIALSSETAQVAALSAAGASAIEAKEHREEAEAEAAAAAAANPQNASSPGASNNTLAPPGAPNSNNLLSLNNLPTSKRKSVMKGVAPPASPLVLSRTVTEGKDDPSNQLPSPSNNRSLGLALSERRAMSISNGVTASAVSSPQQLARRSSLTSPNDSERSSLASPGLLGESMFDVNVEKTSTSLLAAANKPRPFDHVAELEASHGAIYDEVRQLAALTAVELVDASLTSPVPQLSPSHAGPVIIPAFSMKAHQLLHVVPRPREPPPPAAPAAPAAPATKK